MVNGSFETLALRLGPGADVRRELEAIAQAKNISAGVILGAVGSLSQVRLRFAGQDDHAELEGKHEILTLSGMISKAGVHLHMSVADFQGTCKGGHLVYGCEVYTTLEIAIGLISEVEFQRVYDETTEFIELKVSSMLTSKDIW